MIELPLAFLGGLLGSSHCIGMCGGFALSIGTGGGRLTSNFGRQVVYSLGRIFTYAVLGTAAGFLGLHLTSRFSPLVRMQAVLSVVAGAALILQGLRSAGWLTWSRSRGPAACLSKSFFAPFLTAGRLDFVFVAGLLTGLLPCGLVYAYLALAVSTRDPLFGMGLMALFGAGTVPLMVLAGLGGSFLSLAARKHVLHWVACCVIATGVLALSRGVWFLAHADPNGAIRCPACEASVSNGLRSGYPE